MAERDYLGQIPSKTPRVVQLSEGSLPDQGRVETLLNIALLHSTPQTTPEPKEFSACVGVEPRHLQELQTEIAKALKTSAMFGVADISQVITRLHREGLFPNLILSTQELAAMPFESLLRLNCEINEACLGHVSNLLLSRLGQRLASGCGMGVHSVRVDSSATLQIPSSGGRVMYGYSGHMDSSLVGSEVMPAGHSFVSVQWTNSGASCSNRNASDFNDYLVLSDRRFLSQLPADEQRNAIADRSAAELARLHDLNAAPGPVLFGTDERTLGQRLAERRHQVIKTITRPDSLLHRVHCEWYESEGAKYSPGPIEYFSAIMQGLLLEVAQKAAHRRPSSKATELSDFLEVLADSNIIAFFCHSQNESEIRQGIDGRTEKGLQLSAETTEAAAVTSTLLREIGKEAAESPSVACARAFSLLHELYGRNFLHIWERGAVSPD